MLKNRKVIALIPARGGSKGIPGKNIYPLGGIPLVEWAARLGKESSWVDQTLVSTDDPGTYALAEKLGCATPDPRPAELAGDSSRTIDVVANLVDEGVIDRRDILLLLQPTSPLRTGEQLNGVCDRLLENWNTADAVVSVCEIDGPTPYKAQKIEKGYLQSLLGQDASVPRQSLPPTYIPNGAFYLIKVEALLDEGAFIPKRSLPFVMSSLSSINLDTPMDLLLLEAIVDKGWVVFDENRIHLSENTRESSVSPKGMK